MISAVAELCRGAANDRAGGVAHHPPPDSRAVRSVCRLDKSPRHYILKPTAMGARQLASCEDVTVRGYLMEHPILGDEDSDQFKESHSSSDSMG